MTLSCVARVVFFFGGHSDADNHHCNKVKGSKRLVTGRSELAQGQVWTEVGGCLVVSPQRGFQGLWEKEREEGSGLLLIDRCKFTVLLSRFICSSPCRSSRSLRTSS